MANTIFSSEGALLFIMVATVALGFWLQRFKVFFFKQKTAYEIVM